MRICILTHTFPRNDHDIAAAFMKGFSDGLVQSGNEVVVLTPFDTEFRRQGDPFEIVPYKYIWPKSLHVLGYSKTMEADVNLKKRAYFLLPLLIFFGTLALLRVVLQKKIDVINVHWILPNGIMALVVSKLTNTPYVVTIPGTDAYLAHKNIIFGLVARVIANSSSGIVSNSSWLLRKITDLGVNKNIPVKILSYPADVSMFKPSSKGVDLLRKKLNLNKNDFVILAVGRLVYKKGFKYLIEAVSLLRKKYPRLRLIIGGDGDIRGELEELAKRNSVKDATIFAGNISREEISYYYNLADIFVAPSIVDEKGNVDGGPVVSLESMACGKPQILTNVLGMADVIKDGENGYVVPEKDSKALANSIAKLIDNEKLKLRMGKNNSTLARSVLSTEKIGSEYTKFFQNILSR